MARARNIKPGFFKNEDLGELTPVVRLFFIGLWCVADREGRFEDRPRRLWAEIMPYDHYEGEAAMEQLAARGFVVRYEVDGMRCAQIVNFLKHQTPHCKEAPSIIPGPSAESTGKGCDEHRESTGKGGDEHQESTVKGGDEHPLDSLIPGLLDPLIPGFQGRPDGLPSSGADEKSAPAAVTGDHVPAKAKIRQPPAAKKFSSPEIRPAGSYAWDAYASAYLHRYRTAPVRNAKVNGQFAQLAKRLPGDEIEHVVRWYVSSNASHHVRSKHCVDLLLRDCEGLRTEWATGARMTDTEARQIDQHDAGAEAARWVTENMEQLRQARREGKI